MTDSWAHTQIHTHSMPNFFRLRLVLVADGLLIIDVEIVVVHDWFFVLVCRNTNIVKEKSKGGRGDYKTQTLQRAPWKKYAKTSKTERFNHKKRPNK